jgi:eukaryotic-like serine/threonine-protein kinase
MSTERWERTKQILEEALRLASERRLAYLDSVCGSDRELRAEVESLIASHEEAGSQFLAVAASELMLTSSLDPPTAPVNRVIGRYRLVEELGRGGMGQVWLAEQTTPLKRQVALKLIKGGMFDPSAIRRFQSERQSLAIMDHPSIAKVFDAGATPDGQPYFVMEYVPGLPITDYCDQRKLKIHERLDLFTKACEGVQHAHQKAIIHRDLKPANILIVEVDGKPMPRIIDFGVAKITTSQVEGDTLFTQIGSFLGTPGYMSPEQANPDGQDVDTRTDVYSLGVVLYVLLTGFLPFDTKPRQKQSLHELLRQMREEDPPRPSTKIAWKKQSSTATAEMRGTAPNQLVSLLRGDLDWITMKALEKERERRYGTPSELATDIRHYLRNEPVMARPAGAGYRLQKYVRRHRLWVSVAAVISTLLVTFAVVQALQLRRITRERDRADRIAEFTTGIFKVSDPSERVGLVVTAGELLDKASKDIDTGLAKDPELQARMMKVMGTAYSNLGLHQRAQSLFEHSIQIDSSAMGPENPETLNAMKLLAWSLFQQGQLAEAERLQRRVLEIQRRVLGPENLDTLDSMGDLAMIVGEAGNLAEAEKLNREELEKKKHLLGPEASNTLVAMDNLATVLARESQLAEAEKLEQETLEIQLRVFGSENLRAISSMINLAGIQMDEGRYEEAEKGFRQALDLEKRVLGPDQPETALTMYNLACILAQRGQSDEALSLLHQAVDHGLHPRVDLKIEREPKFNSLHGDPRFAVLVTHAKQRAAAAQKPN